MSDLISRCELFNRLATISASPEANELKAQIYAVIQSMEAVRTGGSEMDNRALDIVIDYIVSHLDKTDKIPDFEVYTVWKAKVLQNWKYLISSTLLDGMYYELTFNGDKNEWYLDAYKKFENKVYPDESITDCQWMR